MNKPRNLFLHAMDELNRLGHHETKNIEIAQELRVLYDYITKNAVCWNLDSTALQMIWNTDLDAENLKNIRLPYPVMAVEYEFHNEELGLEPVNDPNKSQCASRVTILVDYNYVAKLLGMENSCSGEFTIYHFFKDERDGGFWGCAPYSIKILYDDLADLSWLPPIGNTQKVVTLRFTGLVPSMSLESMGDLLSLSVDDTIKKLTDQAPMTDDIRVVLGLLQVLSCENAPVRILEAPAKLNKKRQKRGKIAVPAYRTLALSGIMGQATRPQGHHRSPKSHLRRGHVRQQWYPTAGIHKARWIAPTIVNPEKGDVTITDVRVK
jgi:hypothetical protein